MHRILFLTASLLAFAAPASAQTPLAVTIDDLPFVGPLAPGDSREAAIDRMLAAASDVPITGFVTCRNIARDGRDLSRWIDARVALGNHGSSHRALDDLGLAAWRRDLEACQRRLSAAGAEPRFFRYPFLRTGRDRALRDAGFAALRELGLTRAPVSIDTAEYVLARPYADALARHDRARADAIAAAYVDHVRRAARHYRELAAAGGDGDAPQILLLHANALAADHLQDVLAALRDDQFRFIPLDDALQSSLYSRADRYTGGIGLSWLHRIADAPAERAWAWDAAQAHALEVRFAGEAERASFDLDEELSSRRVADGAWVVTHAEPVASNSLVVQVADGTLVLMHTPWDDAHARSLVDYLRARFGEVPMVAIAAHFHGDAVGGSGALIAEGARWIGSDHTARLMRERNARMGAGIRDMARDRPTIAARFERYDPPLPRETFREREGLTLRFGSEEVRLIYPGPAHAPDNIVVFFPARRLLFGGCAVVGMPRMGYLGDADLDAWPRAIERMQALHPDVVVPGHGDRTDPGLLEHTLELVRGVQR